MTQLVLPVKGDPVDVDLGDIARQQSGHGVIALCAQKSGLLDKIIAADVGLQEAVWSRVKSGLANMSLEALDQLMTRCGNEAPLHWLLLRRGYDPRQLHKLESELERRLRETEEELARVKAEREIEKRTVRDLLGRAA